MDDAKKREAADFFESNNLGIATYKGTSFLEGFLFYFPEIFTLFHVMLHILKESLAGVFDVPYDRYETFEEGLLRYRIQMLCTTKEEQEQVLLSFSINEAIKKIEAADIDPFRGEAYFSDFDKFELSEKQNAPIRVKGKLIDEEDDELRRRLEGGLEEMFEEFEDDQQEQQDMNLAENNYKRSKSVDDLRLIEPEVTWWQWFKSLFNLVHALLWDNVFFERLFPIVK